MADISKLKSNAVVSATYDTILQVALRMVSFLLNAFIIRHVSASAFAVMTVRLNLLYATGLFLSREAFRRAALGCKSPKDIKKVVNLIWIGVGGSFCVMIIGWVLWCYGMEAPPLDVTGHYHLGVYLVIMSVLVEMFAESPYIIAELHQWPKVKVMIEGAMQLSRAVLVAFGVSLWPEKAVLVFGVSHVAGSLLYCLAYYVVFARQFATKETTSKLMLGTFRGLFVTFRKGKMMPEVDSEMWKVCVSFLKQGWLKEALTEGEFYLMNFLPLISLPEQGVYQVVSNLGSLAARLVFRSIEAAAYKFFAQSLVRGKPMKDQDKRKVVEVSGFVFTLLRNLILVSLFIVTFGFAYSHPLLQLYGGSNLSSAGCGLLRAQCLYVVFMALNGITEAFTFAAMSDEELETHNKTLVVFSLAYVAVTILAVSVTGVYGFVIGNCVNMVLRITRSLSFMKRAFAGSGAKPLDAIRVSRKVGGAFALAFVVTASSERYVYGRSFAGHVLIGVASVCGVTFALRRDLQEMITSLFNFVDQIYSKVFRVEKRKNKRFNCYVLGFIYKLFYQ